MDDFESWREEKNAAYLYHVMAKHEMNPLRKELFLQLANAAAEQAAIWEKKLINSHKSFTPSLKVRFVAWLITWIDIKHLRYILSAMKVRGMSVYLEGTPKNSLNEKIQTHESWHKSTTSGGNLRAAVFGINDGLISNASLLLGIIGANVNQHFVIISGIAGLLAGACSMAAGEYISVRSQRELFEYQIELEKNELLLYPEEEAAELAAIYRARGLSGNEAERFARSMMANPDKALDVLAREELGLNPNELGSPLGAALSSFFSFTIGASIPLIPFIFFAGYEENLFFTIGLVACSLFAIGAGLSLFTNRNAFISGLRMLIIGSIAGAFTYFIGKLLGVVLT